MKVIARKRTILDRANDMVAAAREDGVDVEHLLVTRHEYDSMVAATQSYPVQRISIGVFKFDEMSACVRVEPRGRK